MRIIVPHNNFITKAASIFIDYHLGPEIARIKWILPDSLTLVNNLEQKPFPYPKIILSTADVEALYPSIPIQDGLHACQIFMTNRTIFSEELQTLIIRLLTTVMTSNTFCFNNEMFKQNVGTAMGVAAAVCFANIFLYILEHDLLQKYTIQGELLSYFRYIDDIFAIFNSATAARSFYAEYNTLHPSIHITITINNNHAEFLDLHIHKGNRFTHTKILDLKLHQKPMNAYQYLAAHSHQPDSVKRGYIKGELIRYVRNCSNEEDFNKTAQLFALRLRARGTTTNFMKKPFSQVRYSDRENYLKRTHKQNREQNPIVVAAPYSPNINQFNIKSTLSKHWHILAKLKNTSNKEIYPSPPLVTYTKGASLRTIIPQKSDV